MSFSLTIKVGPKLEHRYPYLTRALGAREGPCKYLQESLVEKVGRCWKVRKKETYHRHLLSLFRGHTYLWRIGIQKLLRLRQRLLLVERQHLQLLRFHL